MAFLLVLVGADADSIRIANPNNQNYDSEDPSATLVGADAFNYIVSKSSLGKGYSSFAGKDYVKELENNLQGEKPSNTHLDTSSSGQFDPTKGGQSPVRVYTAAEDISIEERDIFDQKVKELKSKSIHSGAAIPYEAKVFKAIDQGIKLTATAPDGRSGFQNFEIDSSFGIEKANGKHIYPCANLIEFLLQINEQIVLRGNFDLGRDAMIEGGNAIRDGALLNDHSTGRGIDIRHIGKTTSEMMDTMKFGINGDLETNRKALNILLDALATIDESILPDLIVFDDRLAQEFGIVMGGDDYSDPAVNGIIQKKFPNVIKTDFAANTGHRNHIHISFSPQRAGTYLDYTEAGSSSAWSNGSTTGADGLALVSIDELFQSKGSGKDGIIQNKDALYKALIDFGGFKPETAALLMMIPERESSFRPSAFNGCLKTGDYSIGLWQLNYYAESNQRFLEDLIDVRAKINGKIVNKKEKLYKLLFKDHEALKINNKTSAVAKMKEIYEQSGGKFDSGYQCNNASIGAGIQFADPVLFTPIVQVDLIKKFLVNYSGKDWKFFPWGEYAGDHPAYGWIHGLKFKTAVDFYVRNNPGKTEQDLVNHCKKFITNMTRKNSKDNYNAWLNGSVFPS